MAETKQDNSQQISRYSENTSYVAFNYFLQVCLSWFEGFV